MSDILPRGGRYFRNGYRYLISVALIALTAVLLLVSPLVSAQKSHQYNAPLQKYSDGTLVLLDKEKELSRRLGSPRYYKVRSDTLRVKPSLGEMSIFWTRNMTDWTDQQIDASLKWIGSHSYIYVAVDTNVSQDILTDLSMEFDTVIYPRVHRLFGSEPIPGIDGDPRITILLTDQGDYVAGYFDPRNQYDVEKSNKREMLVLNIHRLLSDAGNKEDEARQLKSTVAHEFQHLVHFAADPDEEPWINEGLSQYAEYRIYKNTDKLSYFEANPSVSLTEWDWSLESYGAAFAFILYLGEQYSDDGSLMDLVNDPANGIQGVNAFLSKKEAGVDFETLFNNWTIANYLDDPSLAQGQYGYKDINIRVSTDIVNSYPDEGSVFLPPWSSKYLTLAGNRQRHVKMDFSLAANSQLPAMSSIVGSSESTSVVDQAVQRGEETWSAFLPPTYMPLTLIMRSNDFTTSIYPYTFRTSNEKSDYEFTEGSPKIITGKNKSNYDWAKFGSVFVFALGLVTTVITKGASSV